MKQKLLNNFLSKRTVWLSILVGLLSFILLSLVFQQTKIYSQNNIPFRIGEKLTYNISFEKFKNVAYAETEVVSSGKLEETEAIELSSKIKSVDLISAAFFLIDEKRKTFVSAETGLPLYTRKVSNSEVLPKETIYNYLKNPTSNYDLLSLIYKVRQSGGFGTFLLEENGKIQSVSVQTIGSEQFTNQVGSFETNISTVESPFLTALGITNLKINFTQNKQKVPILIRFSTPKGDISAEIASIQIKERVEIENTPTPTPIPTRTPIPIPTPTPYQKNQPLSVTLPFELGETLEFNVTEGSTSVGKVVLQATERKQIQGKDSLLLRAFVKEENGSEKIFSQEDKIITQVDPISLMPTLSELNFLKVLREFNQQVIFDQGKGQAIISGNSYEIPVGTHNILSLAYAIRSFNLKPSRDPKNPVNDTRVAVFLGSEAYVFSLRPSDSEIIDQKGNKTPAQLITFQTGNSNIDKLNLQVWLGVDKNRLPLRVTVAGYQADLVSSKIISPK